MNCAELEANERYRDFATIIDGTPYKRTSKAIRHLEQWLSWDRLQG